MKPDNQKNSNFISRSQNLRFAKIRKNTVSPCHLKSFCAEGVISEKHSGFKEDSEITITDEGLVQYKIERPNFRNF